MLQNKFVFLKEIQDFYEKLEHISNIKLFLIIFSYLFLIFLYISMGILLFFTKTPIYESIDNALLLYSDYFNIESGIEIVTNTFIDSLIFIIQNLLFFIFGFFIIFIVYFYLYLYFSKSDFKFKELFKLVLIYYSIPLTIILISIIINIICFLIFKRFSSFAFFIFPFVGYFIFLYYTLKRINNIYTIKKRILFFSLITIIVFILLLIIIILYYINPWIVFYDSLAYFGALE
jgi:hypothetical protein